MVVLLAALCTRIAGTPLVILAAAILPASVYALILALLDRRDPEPASLRVIAFLSGAVVAASLATTVNALLPGWLTVVTSEAEARLLAPMLGIPVVEELAKAATLLVLFAIWRRELRGVLDGIVYGALVGLGFAVSENVLYLTLAALQGGYSGLVRGAYLRSILYGLNHAAFTATTGAALGFARTTTSRTLAVVVPLAAFSAAVAQHALWNSVASDAIVQILCSPLVPGGACREPPEPWSLYVSVPLMVALFIGPGLATLLAVTALSRGRA